MGLTTLFLSFTLDPNFPSPPPVFIKWFWHRSKILQRSIEYTPTIHIVQSCWQSINVYSCFFQILSPVSDILVPCSNYLMASLQIIFYLYWYLPHGHKSFKFRPMLGTNGQKAMRDFGVVICCDSTDISSGAIFL